MVTPRKANKRAAATPLPPFGATLDATGCHFRVWAPHAARVAVTGDFNKWNDPGAALASHDDGSWSGHVAGARVGQEYLYIIDNRGGDEFDAGAKGLRRIDPWARDMRHASGNAIIVDVAAELRSSGLADDPFDTPAPADWLIYQVHVGSFAGRGDGIDTGPNTTASYPQFEEKLSYIRSMGFNAIALLPVQENPGDGNEGYGPAHLFAPESSYGTPLQLRHMIRAAHDAGLAVLFDVVWNHLNDIDNRLWNFDGMNREGGIYFEGGQRSPWGPRLALWKREVRDMVLGAARMCFEEYHVDGLRLDAADEIATELLDELIQMVRGNPMWSGKMMIAEWSGNDMASWDRVIEQLNFDRVWALGDPYHFREAVDEVVHPDPATRVAEATGVLELPHAAWRIRYLLGSHDNAHDNEDGKRGRYRHFVELFGGRENWHARAKARLAWALCIALPGTPMCFMGSEFQHPGYWHPRFDANPGHGDHRLNWQYAGDPIGLEMRDLVTAANALWWHYPSLRSADLQIVHINPDSGVLAFGRPGGVGSGVLVVTNLSETSWPDTSYRLPLADDGRSWRVVLDSQAAEHGGDGLGHPDEMRTADGVLSLTIPRWSTIILAG
ncbi:MAG TPA: alpha-amylase family glycosyl hydrolase [Gemmatimonadales bacterium]|jgi:1,4-alpha-glucan branching enzyme